MTGTTLPNDQGNELLRRLATDDDFRTRFEADPAAALVELGVDTSTVAGLAEKCCTARPLAAKADFAALVKQADTSQFTAAMAMNVPTMAID